jgi:two-component SAPR family response regulator
MLPEGKVSPKGGYLLDYSTSDEARRDRLLSVLVTSTDARMADMIAAMLTACGHSTSQIAEYVDGLRVMDSFVFDVLVIAIDQDGSTSLAFAIAAKAKLPAMRIVWISKDVGTTPALAKSVVDAFLSIPFTLDQLQNCVQERLPAPRT